MSRRMISQKDQDYVEVLSTAIDADKEGNAEVDGNLKVNGTITQNTYVLDENTGLALTSDAQTKGFSIYYQHVRISNGKLNIAIGVTLSHPSANINAGNSLFNNASITLPADVMLKLYDTIGNTIDIKTETCRAALNNDGAVYGVVDYGLICRIARQTTTQLVLELITTDLISATTTDNFIWRFEFNFLLS